MAVIQGQVAISQTPAEVFAGARSNASQVFLRNTGEIDLLIGPQSFVNAPLNFTATAVADSGTFTAGTYFWRVTSVNAYGETAPSLEVMATVVHNGSVDLTWDAVEGATQYNLYRSGVSYGEDQSPALVTTVEDGTAFTDTGAATTSGATPADNTAQIPLLFPFKKDEMISWTARSTDTLMAQAVSSGAGQISVLLVG